MQCSASSNLITLSGCNRNLKGLSMSRRAMLPVNAWETIPSSLPELNKLRVADCWCGQCRDTLDNDADRHKQGAEARYLYVHPSTKCSLLVGQRIYCLIIVRWVHLTVTLWEQKYEVFVCWFLVSRITSNR